MHCNRPHFPNCVRIRRLFFGKRLLGTIPGCKEEGGGWKQERM